MHDTLINILTAREQTGLFLAGLALIFLAGAILADYLITQKNSLRLKARISGIRLKQGTSKRMNPIYFPVVVYTAPNGKKIEAETDSGSSSIADKIPGKDVRIFVNMRKPFEVRITGFMRPVLSMIFLITGLLLTILSTTQYDITFWFPLLTVLALSAILPRLIRYPSAGTFQNVWEKKSYKKRVYEKKQMRKLKFDEIIKRLHRQQKQNRIMTPVMILISMSLLIGGLYWMNDTKGRIASGSRTVGEVVGVKRNFVSHENKTYFHAVVEFTLPGGNAVRFQDPMGSTGPVPKTGEKVSVIYDPKHPEQAVIDRGMWNYFPPLGLIGAGLILLLLGVKSLRLYYSVSKKLQVLIYDGTV